jgi:glycerol uptake facilitator-like aquaporin
VIGTGDVAGWSVMTDTVSDNATAAANDPRAGASFERCGRLTGRLLTLQPPADQLVARYLGGQSVSFFTLLTVYATAIDQRGPWNALAGLCIGGAVTVGILVAGPLTGAALNPARAFGPALISGFWTHHLVYWSGPLLGGVIAGACYTTFFLGKRKG